MAQSSKLANLADELWKLSVEELEGFSIVVSKILETKSTLRSAEEGSAVSHDRAAADDLREIRRTLEDTKFSLSGPESVLVAAFYKQLEGAEALDTRALNITLDSYGRKPSNTTTTVENLEKKGHMEVLKGDSLHAHKSFRLTETGTRETRELLERLARKND
ncbi:hypothetical protein N9940_00625 [bacterium]|nr:hypothetical protein [Akkermansiaceae bacterium]MDB4296079.1 hypothetical protein [bacterium]MDB4323265.1 hypothetical protein [Akkermansiaceae bacterium]MDB4333658.1 hypothetical protein [Akkermansiaceae bacterium]